MLRFRVPGGSWFTCREKLYRLQRDRAGDREVTAQFFKSVHDRDIDPTEEFAAGVGRIERELAPYLPFMGGYEEEDDLTLVYPALPRRFAPHIHAAFGYVRDGKPEWHFYARLLASVVPNGAEDAFKGNERLFSQPNGSVSYLRRCDPKMLREMAEPLRFILMDKDNNLHQGTSYGIAPGVLMDDWEITEAIKKMVCYCEKQAAWSNRRGFVPVCDNLKCGNFGSSPPFRASGIRVPMKTGGSSFIPGYIIGWIAASLGFLEEVD